MIRNFLLAGVMGLAISGAAMAKDAPDAAHNAVKHDHVAKHSATDKATATSAAIIGQMAPAFTAKDSNGKEHKLSDFKGKIVVLEWTNHECPFVRKHYNSGNMQKLQQQATKDGVVWLSVISSAEGKNGYVTGKEANVLTVERKAHPTAVLLDAEGVIGHAYGAKTTPHMFVIDKEGKLAYMGAIDSKPTPSPTDIAGATNYVVDAIKALQEGKMPKTTSTQAYGCGVKY